ncbi:hypothetical protein PVL29_002940 [Vitis rotundifolia]|uniref:C2H2-type domain-containing protein n=1 Tax=Vitis rotundifolia TaxID=103349 RepID=A0AA39AE29_VITRO|nr:hypothetical protein PVL29_002940 [Vitis rotundifolia]
MNINTDLIVHTSKNPVETFGNLDSSQQSGSNYQIQNQNPRKKRSNPSGIVKAKSGKKADPSAPKITRPCSECGKKFWSWKALFGHMRCHPERQWRGINPPPNYRRSEKGVEDVDLGMSEDDHEVAACLLMLANGAGPIERTSHCMLAYQADGADGLDALGGGCRFECSSCKKCSICLRVFSSGQALGGHKRCHWERGDEPPSSSSSLPQGLNPFAPKAGFGLDLNLPAPLEDDSYCSHSSNLALDLRLGL